MNEAPVGWHCPDCVQAERKRIPKVKGTRQWGMFTPAVAVITAICVLLFGVDYFLGLTMPGAVESFNSQFGMWPLAIALDSEYYRLITSAFLHSGFLHLAMNMLVLVLLGPTLERLFGTAKFVGFYFAVALGGSVSSYFFSPVNTLSVGASGAIFGLLGALLVVGKKAHVDVRQLWVLLLINVGIGFASPGIDWRAHLGGLVVGAALAALLGYGDQLLGAARSRRSLLQWGWIGAFLVVLGAMAYVRSDSIVGSILELMQ